MGRRKEYEGQEITVSFDMSRCIHARNCFLKLPEVFDPAQRPWVQPDRADAEEVTSVIRSCPSGALKFQRKDGTGEAPPKINRIAILENGPLAVAGALEIEGAEEVRATLCRCGLSKTKPYCDGSHVEGEFTATGEPPAGDATDGDGQGGTLDLRRASDGPLMAKGPVEVTTGTGRKVATGEKLFLCRCGQSANKPFCDGSHKAAGFEDKVS